MTCRSKRKILNKINRISYCVSTPMMLFLILGSISFPRNMGYLDFEVFINNDPYPANIFVHTTRSYPRYMAMIDTLIEPAWFINSAHLGLDFKVNQNNLSYFDGMNNS